LVCVYSHDIYVMLYTVLISTVESLLFGSWYSRNHDTLAAEENVPSLEVSALVTYSTPSDPVILPTLSGLIEPLALL